MTIIYAFLFGLTMKLADLLDEHGLKWFKGSAILFGIIWGVSGALLVSSDNVIANIILAMSLAFLVRNRLDFLNHQIAVAIIVISFLLTSIFSPILFSIFFIVFVIFGSLRDYIGDKIERKSSLQSLYDNIMWYYPISTFIYCLFYGDWYIFLVFTVYTIAYDATKAIFKKNGIY